jgi:hypothetical protein
MPPRSRSSSSRSIGRAVMRALPGPMRHGWRGPRVRWTRSRSGSRSRTTRPSSLRRDTRPRWRCPPARARRGGSKANASATDPARHGLERSAAERSLTHQSRPGLSSHGPARSRDTTSRGSKIGRRASGDLGRRFAGRAPEDHVNRHASMLRAIERDLAGSECELGGVLPHDAVVRDGNEPEPRNVRTSRDRRWKAGGGLPVTVDREPRLGRGGKAAPGRCVADARVGCTAPDGPAMLRHGREQADHEWPTVRRRGISEVRS